MPNWLTISADVMTALASVAAVIIAIIAWRLAAITFKRDHRPLVRVVVTRTPSALGHEPPPENMSLVTLILKICSRASQPDLHQGGYPGYLEGRAAVANGATGRDRIRV